MVKTNYSKESAGSRMINKVPLCSINDKIVDVRDRMFKEASSLETINYVYVVQQNKLVGVFSLKEIFQRKDNESVINFMIKDIVKIKPEQDQERAAYLAIKHNLKAIPVVDKNNMFLGVIPSDIILSILHEENIEDLFLSVGLNKKDGFSNRIIDAPVKLLAKIKLPWLIVGLFGGILAAQVTTLFEEPLKSHFILAAFIPLIVYMADAVGSQTQTLFIRNLTINNFSHKKYFIKEIKVGLLISIVLSLIIFVIASLLAKQILIGFILAVSLFLTILTAIIISMFIPNLLFKLGKDPALGSGPFGTIIADISSLLIYFIVASALLQYS